MNVIKIKVKEMKDGPEVEHEIIFSCAAIRFYDRENGVWIEFYGRRHHEIIKDIHDKGYSDDYKSNHIDGFMYIIDDNPVPIFIDRDTATELAKSAGIPMIGCVLTSEDLW